MQGAPCLPVFVIFPPTSNLEELRNYSFAVCHSWCKYTNTLSLLIWFADICWWLCGQLVIPFSPQVRRSISLLSLRCSLRTKKLPKQRHHPIIGSVRLRQQKVPRQHSAIDVDAMFFCLVIHFIVCGYLDIALCLLGTQLSQSQILIGTEPKGTKWQTHMQAEGTSCLHFRQAVTVNYL